MYKKTALCMVVTAIVVMIIMSYEFPAPAHPEHTEPDCLDSYPDFCIPPGTPDLNCSDIQYSDFTVRGSDPHRFDADNDGIGCESSQSRHWYVEPDTSKPDTPVMQKHAAPDCLNSYPDFCIPPGTPDLNCSDIQYSDFTVRGSDPHRFDADNDGIGCESSQSRHWYVEPDTSKPDTPVMQKHAAPDCLNSYPDFCIPPGTPDLNCSDIQYSDFTVRGSDPHGFDRDRDGVGCES